MDSVSLDAAANPGAYHAWRAYRGPALPAQQAASPSSLTSGEGSALGRNRRPGEWNWDGVWEERVKRAVNASLSESVLYGPGAGDDIVGHRHRRVDFSALHPLTRLDTFSTSRQRDHREDEAVPGHGHCKNGRDLIAGAGLVFDVSYHFPRRRGRNVLRSSTIVVVASF